MNTKAKQNGFTIIEVVLVLAIAALIFLMIFIAWPALQRSQRDTSRKHDIDTIASAVSSYRSTYNGKNPTQWTTTATSKGLDRFIDKLDQYDFVTTPTNITFPTAAAAVSAPTDINQVRIVVGAKCDDNTNGATNTGATNRQVAILGALEGGGGTNTVPFCQGA